MLVNLLQQQTMDHLRKLLYVIVECLYIYIYI